MLYQATEIYEYFYPLSFFLLKVVFCVDNFFGYVWIPFQSNPFSIDVVSLHICIKSGGY